jgi:hypothetical protein
MRLASELGAQSIGALVKLEARGPGKSCHCKLRASPAKATMELPFALNCLLSIRQKS